MGWVYPQSIWATSVCLVKVISLSEKKHGKNLSFAACNLWEKIFVSPNLKQPSLGCAILGERFAWSVMTSLGSLCGAPESSKITALQNPFGYLQNPKSTPTKWWIFNHGRWELVWGVFPNQRAWYGFFQSNHPFLSKESHPLKFQSLWRCCPQAKAKDRRLSCSSGAPANFASLVRWVWETWLRDGAPIRHQLSRGAYKNSTIEGWKNSGESHISFWPIHRG